MNHTYGTICTTQPFIHFPYIHMCTQLYFAFCIVCLETLKGGVRSHSDRMYTLATNSGALVIAFWLLYKRLGDAVEVSLVLFVFSPKFFPEFFHVVVRGESMIDAINLIPLNPKP